MAATVTTGARTGASADAAALAPVGVGVIGAGMISTAYLTNLTSFPDLRVVILGDLDTARASARAEQHGVPEWGTPDDVLAHAEVELVVNLTVPVAHVPVSSAAISSGKHVWSEKPIGIDRTEALGLLDQAASAGLRVGIAPDTVLGRGVQTARRAIARGDIGVPLSAQTTMQHVGPDLSHPNPEFLFARGAGPVLDMGPYYLSTLVTIFGPIARVAAVGAKGRETRVIRVGDRAGAEFPVEVPTLVHTIAQFEQGGVSQSVFSFDSPLVRTGVVEITGTEGTLMIPDPNMFTGDVRITRAPSLERMRDEAEWTRVPLVGSDAGRGLGVLDMARAIRGGRQHVATGELGFHVLDAMIAIEESIATGRFVEIASRVGTIPLAPDDRDPRLATL
jgi:predicted dehydrogenase